MNVGSRIAVLGKQLRISLPMADDNKQFLRSRVAGWSPNAVRWDKPNGYWVMTKNDDRYTRLVDALVLRYGSVEIVRQHKTTQICTVSCRNAKRELCECSCDGAYHKAGLSGDPRDGYVIGEVIIMDIDTRIVNAIQTVRNGWAADCIQPTNGAQRRRHSGAGGDWRPPSDLQIVAARVNPDRTLLSLSRVGTLNLTDTELVRLGVATDLLALDPGEDDLEFVLKGRSIRACIDKDNHLIDARTGTFAEPFTVEPFEDFREWLLSRPTVPLSRLRPKGFVPRHPIGTSELWRVRQTPREPDVLELVT